MKQQFGNSLKTSLEASFVKNSIRTLAHSMRKILYSSNKGSDVKFDRKKINLWHHFTTIFTLSGLNEKKRQRHH